jgi:hypothetical protein
VGFGVGVGAGAGVEVGSGVGATVGEGGVVTDRPWPPGGEATGTGRPGEGDTLDESGRMTAGAAC